MNNDILNRLQTVVEHARIGVDPVWLKMAITEIQQLRANNLQLQQLIDNIIDAANLDTQLDAIGDAETERKHTWQKLL